MNAKFEVSGFDEIYKELDNMQEQVNELENKKLDFGELFSSDFMGKHARGVPILKLFESGGFDVHSQEDIDAIPIDELNQFISEHTDFSSWKEMNQAASSEYIASAIKL